jgi:microcystin degradation protein MlrC
VTRRVFIGALGTETNQFVPFPTGLRGYQEHGVFRGDATEAPADQLHRAGAMSGGATPRRAAGR